MRIMKGFIVKNLLFVMLAALVASTAFLHILQTSEGIRIYRKDQISLKDTWLDLTTLSMSQLRHHAEVVTVLLRKGDERLLPGGPVLRGLYDLGLDMQQALEKIDGEIKVTESLGELKNLGRRKAQELRQKVGEVGQDLENSADQLKVLLKSK